MPLEKRFSGTLRETSQFLKKAHNPAAPVVVQIWRTQRKEVRAALTVEEFRLAFYSRL